MRLFKILSLGAITLMLAALSSCTKNVELLDTVPADSKLVATVDLRAVCGDAGVRFTADGVEYDDALQGKINTKADRIFGVVGRLDANDIADMEHVVVVSTAAGEAYATFGISGFEAFREACGDRIVWGDDAEGMHVGTLEPRTSVVASDTQVWLTDENPTVAKGVKELLKAADQLSIKKVPGIERMLEGEAPVNVAVLSGKFDVKGGRDAALGGVWNTAGMTMPEGKLAVAWTRMKGDGEKVPLKGLQPINPAVLAYVASDPTVAVGAGLTPEFDWSHIAGLAMLTGDFQTQAMMSVAMPYLAAIDGTVMLAASPADSQAFADIDPGNWNFVLLAHMPQDKIDKLLGTVRTMCFTAGIKPEVDAKTGIMSIRQYGMNLHLGNVDGYFAISNNPFSDTGDNSLAPQFTGKNGAARISLPSLAPLGPGLPAWGLNMEATVGDAEGNLVVSLPGSEGSVLLNLLSVLL